MSPQNCYLQAFLAQIILHQGSRGEAVIRLQNRLNNLGFHLAVDGVFGLQTEAAVKQYQQDYRLKVDGIVEEQTGRALFPEFW
ncbi:MAG: peptidoglycan-binding domain-containing protein [Cyanobacteria bacterium J06592_8]